MKIKICGLFRDEDIDYVNEARPDFCGFVFAPSKRQVSAELAARLRRRLAEGIIPVGVFVNAPPEDIAALYRDGVISIAQLHGDESEEYIARLKEASGNAPIGVPIPVIQVIKHEQLDVSRPLLTEAEYILIDSGAGSGNPFDWDLLNPPRPPIPDPHSPFTINWFLAGGISIDNIERAMTLNPFAVDVSSGAETNGVKDREKILQLTSIVRKGNSV